MLILKRASLKKETILGNSLQLGERYSSMMQLQEKCFTILC